MARKRAPVLIDAVLLARDIRKMIDTLHSDYAEEQQTDGCRLYNSGMVTACELILDHIKKSARRRQRIPADEKPEER